MSVGSLQSPQPESARSAPVPSPETVQLKIPASFAFVRLTRLVISGLATQVPFTLDETEDLRIAVDELCSTLIDASADGSELVATFVLAERTLSFEATVPTGKPVELDELSSHILAASVDSHSVTSDGSTAVARMAKTSAALAS
jgi:serine/threonine-protein kinase RsbW